MLIKFSWNLKRNDYINVNILFIMVCSLTYSQGASCEHIDDSSQISSEFQSQQRSASRTGLEAYFHFKFRLSRLKTSLEACINSKYHLSQPTSSSQAYVGFKFLFSKSTPKTIWQKYTPPCVGNIVDAFRQLKRGWTV